VPASLESGIEARGLSALELGESHERAMFPDGALDRRCPGALGTDARADDQQAESRLL
jgi:hypothetical protein